MEVARSGGRSSLKVCFTFCDKRFVGFAIIRMLHADRLRLRFALERVEQIHIKLAVEHLFGLAECERWTTRELFGEIVSRGRELCRGNDAIVKSDAFGFHSTDEVASEKDFRSFRESNYTRQQIRGGHVRTREPDFHKQKCDLCCFARDANVGSECDTRAGTGSSAVETRNHRFRKQANILNELARHACELE